MTNGLRIRCLTWDPDCERSRQIAARLGIDLEIIHYLAYRRPAVAPFKYALQTAATVRALVRDPADVVLIQNPPPFAPLAALLAQRLRPEMRIVVDIHTGPFIEPKWRWFVPLTRFVARRAALTLVTNDQLRAVVDSWGARGYVLSVPLPRLPPARRVYPLDRNAFRIAAVCSFSDDEPIASLLDVRDLPDDVRLYVTGDFHRAPARLRRRKSSRVRLCGFVDAADYTSLLEQSDAVLALCTRPLTILQGAADAAALGKPLVTSDWPEMRRTFRAGTVWVGDTTKSIEAGIRAVRRDREALGAEMAVLAAELRARWEVELQELLRRLAEGEDGAASVRRPRRAASAASAATLEEST
jgi:glycosyltransferase involved in cell wall biosynthesis